MVECQLIFRYVSLKTTDGPPLDEDYWHVTDYYDNIRNKVKSMPESAGVCYKGVDVGLPKRVCNTPMRVSFFENGCCLFLLMFFLS